MSATLFYNGIKISVPTHELGEALRQISRMSQAESLPPPWAAGQKALELDETPDKRSDEEMTLAFLKVIGDHSISGGAPIREVMAALGAKHEKGVGSKAAVVNRVLDKYGYAFPDVYSNNRDSYGDRFWRAGDRFKEALAALELTRKSADVADDEL